MKMSLPPMIVITKKAALKRLWTREGQFDECLFLSADYSSFMSLRQKLQHPEKLSLPGAIFHQKLEQNHSEYLSLFCKINETCQSLSFWGTHTGSRNSLAFPLLRNLIFLSVAKDVASRKDALRRVFVFESRATLKVFLDWCHKNNLEVITDFTFRDTSETLRLGVMHQLHALVFLIKSAVTWIWGRALRNPRLRGGSHPGRVLLRTWITAGSFTKDLKFKNRNFGALPEFLSKNQKEIWILPMFFNLDRPLLKQMFLMARAMIKGGDKFIFQEQYLTPLDYFTVVRRGFREAKRRFKMYIFDGDDVSQMIQEAHQKTCYYGELLNFNLSERLVHKLKVQKIVFEKIIYPLENNVVEKPFNLAVKRDFPNTELIGFQHTVWVKEQLGAVLHSQEMNFHPLPDKIICCGPKYVELLGQLGFPKDRLLLGANLRYPEMHGVVDMAQRDMIEPKPRTSAIAIVLNAFWDESAELLDQVKQALDALGDLKTKFKLVIKLHPLLKEQTVRHYLREIKFSDYELVNLKVLELSSSVKAVIMPSASISNLEIIVSGTPLLRVSSGANFDLDPLWDQHPFFPVAKNPVELAAVMKKALSLKNVDDEELKKYGEKVLSLYFSPVTDEFLKVFL